jgi:hypothetical protein
MTGGGGLDAGAFACGRLASLSGEGAIGVGWVARPQPAFATVQQAAIIGPNQRRGMGASPFPSKDPY